MLPVTTYFCVLWQRTSKGLATQHWLLQCSLHNRFDFFKPTNTQSPSLLKKKKSLGFYQSSTFPEMSELKILLWFYFVFLLYLLRDKSMVRFSLKAGCTHVPHWLHKDIELRSSQQWRLSSILHFVLFYILLHITFKP